MGDATSVPENALDPARIQIRRMSGLWTDWMLVAIFLRKH
jgi:hypothetical protein